MITAVTKEYIYIYPIVLDRQDKLVFMKDRNILTAILSFGLAGASIITGCYFALIQSSFSRCQFRAIRLRFAARLLKFGDLLRLPSSSERNLNRV